MDTLKRIEQLCFHWHVCILEGCFRKLWGYKDWLIWDVMERALWSDLTQLGEEKSIWRRWGWGLVHHAKYSMWLSRVKACPNIYVRDRCHGHFGPIGYNRESQGLDRSVHVVKTKYDWLSKSENMSDEAWSEMFWYLEWNYAFASDKIIKKFKVEWAARDRDTRWFLDGRERIPFLISTNRMGHSAFHMQSNVRNRIKVGGLKSVQVRNFVKDRWDQGWREQILACIV